MPYCDTDEILNIIPMEELINLTVDEPEPDSIVDIERFNKVAQYADEVINGYLRARYTLPLKHVPALVKKLASDIAAYRLYFRRPLDMPEHIKENHKLAIKLLGDIQKGMLLLDMPQEYPDSDIEKPKPSYRSNKDRKTKLFNDDFFNCYRGLKC